ncbi:8-oxo-dGTP diphosphatase MutT [Pedobacter sp. KBW06]|uniref:(deoxy)nucleoside triphosphate pyrophosphohydrolase n=1 Tax=Pedobacter sp. KBW06 TaxID=2153359 RepID=UPI000F5B17AE|nr:(deoxy)nucleoside triphosphate pyrophosphohydrolase [Pedobacter sp. KBW06]RQO74044.1 8-oxo-dGTP diphosphatase MutT [Pedobacter sp. KBW06]
MIDVCCAIIVSEEGKILVAQRSARMLLPLKMEFPGGKIEPGESAEACLIREIKEELNVEIQILSERAAHQHVYPEFSIRLIPFVCRIIAGDVVLREHASYSWLETSALPACDWAAADIPIVNDYLDSLEIN